MALLRCCWRRLAMASPHRRPCRRSRSNLQARPRPDPSFGVSGFGGRGRRGAGAAVIPVPSGVRGWVGGGRTDMRKGMNGFALPIQEQLKRDPHAGDLYVFRGKRGHLVKILWHDGIGMSLYAKRLERGRFVWPAPAKPALAQAGGIVAISAA